MIKYIVVVLAFLSTSVDADRVTVRSGDHQRFTRLVLYYPSDNSWTISVLEEEVTLKFSGERADLDMSSIFDRISRQRIREVSTDFSAQSITIDVNCDCFVEAWQHSTGIMVVDVIDFSDGALRDANENATSIVLLLDKDTDASQSQSNITITDMGSVLFAEAFHASNTSLPVHALSAFPQASENRRQDSPSRPTPTITPGVTTSDFGLLRRHTIEEAEQRLLEQIARGVAQGSLIAETETTFDVQHQNAEASSNDADERRLMDSAGVQWIIDDEILPLRAETSIDRAASDPAQSLRDIRCVPSANLDFSGRVVGDSFFGSVSEARQQLDVSSTTIRAEKEEALALTYLYWSFGAEAEQVLSASVLPASRARQLIAQAQIIDRGHATQPSDLRAHSSCSGAAALWALLAPETWSGSQQVNVIDVVSSFSALPSHLRLHIGPGLVERLIEANEIGGAREVQRIMTRQARNDNDLLQLSNARINVAAGDQGSAIADLKQIATSNSNDAPRALLEFSNLLIAQDELISEDFIELLGAYGFENRNTPLGDAILSNQALALARAGNIADAFRVIDTELGDTDNLTDTTNNVVRLASSFAEDDVFLRMAFSRTETDRLKLDAPTLNNVGSRLIELGFADQALAYLDREHIGAEETQRRLLRAEALLSKDEAEAALVELREQQGDRAALIRARANSRLNRHREAYIAFEELNNEPAAQREAILGNQWEELVDTDDLVIANAARALASVSETKPEAEITLEQSRALVESSRQTRAALEALMLRYTPRSELE